MPRIALLALSQLGSAPLQRVALAGHDAVLLIHRNGRYVALADTCSHGAASLSEGELVGDEILCPHHRGGFDIRSGAPTRPPCAVPLARYEVSIEDDVVYIEVDE